MILDFGHSTFPNARSREHHFITNIDLKPTEIFVESYKQQTLNISNWDKISGTLCQLTPIHYAFGSLVFLIVLVMSCCLLAVCYKRVHALLGILTCNLCCKDKLIARRQYLMDRQRLRTQARARVKFSELKTTDPDKQPPISLP